MPRAADTGAGTGGVLTPQVMGALSIVYVVWGSTYLAIKLAQVTIPTFLMLAGRFAIAGVLLYAWSIRRGDVAGDRPEARAWVDAAIVAGGLLVGGLGLVAVGMRTVPSGIAAVMVATAPLWMTLFDRVLFGVRLGRTAIAGLLLGFAGVAVLVWPDDGGGFDAFGITCLVVSPVIWSAGTVYTKRARQPARPLVATSLQMLTGSVLLLAVGTALGEWGELDLSAISGRSLVAFAYLTIVGSLIAFSAYVWLLMVAPISLVSTYAYVNPVVAIALGWLIDGEPVTLHTLVAGAVILAGVALIVSAQARGPAPPADDDEREPAVRRRRSGRGTAPGPAAAGSRAGR